MVVSFRDRLSVRDGLENIFGVVMACGENVGGSSQSGRIATTRRNRDGWCRFVTVCQFVRVLENT